MAVAPPKGLVIYLFLNIYWGPTILKVECPKTIKSKACLSRKLGERGLWYRPRSWGKVQEHTTGAELVGQRETGNISGSRIWGPCTTVFWNLKPDWRRIMKTQILPYHLTVPWPFTSCLTHPITTPLSSSQHGTRNQISGQTVEFRGWHPFQSIRISNSEHQSRLQCAEAFPALGPVCSFFCSSLTHEEPRSQALGVLLFWPWKRKGRSLHLHL